MTTRLAVALLENEYWWGGAAHYGDWMLIHGTGEFPSPARGAERSVRLPKGKWQSWRGEIFDGGQTLRLPVTLRDIPRFNRLHTTVR